MSLWSSIKRTGAAIGVAASLGGTSGAAVVKNADPTLTKQYAKHARHVRLEQTGRDIARTLDEATRANGAANRHTHVTAKDLKKLK